MRTRTLRARVGQSRRIQFAYHAIAFGALSWLLSRDSVGWAAISGIAFATLAILFETGREALRRARH